MSLTKNIILWVLAIIIMSGFAIYQRTTGPTYPFRGQIELEGEKIKFSLPRTHEGNTDQKVYIIVKNREIKAEMNYRRHPSHDDWTTIDMMRSDDSLIAFIPNQPPAGKIMYNINLIKNTGEKVKLIEKPVITRFKGVVPNWLLITHIIFVFSAVIFSTRTAFEAIFKGKNYVKLTLITLILMFFGVVIFGPIMQYYAFGEFWTGWPLKGWLNFGDLTDNKSAVMFLGWLIAYFKIRKNPDKKHWIYIAAIITIATFLIPHSLMGSEIDYTKIKN
ncbi:MAG: hypothetical protein N2319_11785 [Candidatus Kapabacteria bacterium]|nr:hypothetical protein [Candidatus Kapabacteria bacterium]